MAVPPQLPLGTASGPQRYPGGSVVASGGVAAGAKTRGPEVAGSGPCAGGSSAIGSSASSRGSVGTFSARNAYLQAIEGRSEARQTERLPQLLPLSRATPARCGRCPWCRGRLPPVCCPKCLKQARQVSRENTTNAEEQQQAMHAAQEAIALYLDQRSPHAALLDRHASVSLRLKELRTLVSRRKNVVGAAQRVGDGRNVTLNLRQTLRNRKEALRQRRDQHEARVAEWTAARRKLEAKKLSISRSEFLSNPAQHGAALGSFHVYHELHVVNQALQSERRRRCAELANIFPLKWIDSGNANDERTLTLGQVCTFSFTGELEDEQLKDLEAAVSHLCSLTAALGTCLDVTAPFPCTAALGFAEHVSREMQSRSRRASGSKQGSEGSSSSSSRTAGAVRGLGPSAAVGVARTKPWLSPCVAHPFRNRWYFFSVYDGLCTPDFQMALRLLDEDLRHLCNSQGPQVRAQHLGTLQLIAHLLSTPGLGSVSPPAPCYLVSSSIASASSPPGSAPTSARPQGTLPSGMAHGAQSSSITGSVRSARSASGEADLCVGSAQMVFSVDRSGVERCMDGGASSSSFPSSGAAPTRRRAETDSVLIAQTVRNTQMGTSVISEDSEWTML